MPLAPNLLCAAKPRNPVPAGTHLQVIGLGDLGNGTVTPVLQRTALVLERLETCNEAWAADPDRGDFLEASMICAGAWCSSSLSSRQQGLPAPIGMGLSQPAAP